MTYRCLRVQSAKSLTLKHNSLIAIKEEKQIEIPLEDIAMVLLEDNKTMISGKLLTALASNYIGLIVCDDKYMPCSLSLPMVNHYRQLKVFELQMNVRKPVISQLWYKIIESKIKNQMSVIKLTSKDEFYYEKMDAELSNMKSNDKTNKEAISAKYHFSAMFKETFKRRRTSDDEINVALNYGYTILMAAMARTLAMFGFNTVLGIHHCAYTNNFNLACDLMEPYRALVDKIVYDSINDLSYPLTTSVKHSLISVLTKKVRLDNKIYLVEFSMEEVVKSYINVLDKQDSSLIKLPEIIENDFEVNEDENEL